MSLIWGQNSTYIDIINIDVIHDIIDCLFILHYRWQPETRPVRCAASSSQLP
jgi:hypothetical protein